MKSHFTHIYIIQSVCHEGTFLFVLNICFLYCARMHKHGSPLSRSKTKYLKRTSTYFYSVNSFQIKRGNWNYYILILFIFYHNVN